MLGVAIIFNILFKKKIYPTFSFSNNNWKWLDLLLNYETGSLKCS